MKKKLSDLMIVASFLSSLFYAASYPYIYAESLKAVTKHYISFEQIISCIAITCFCVVWNKYSDRLFKHYRLMLWAEIIADAFLMIYAAVTQDMKFYFVLNVLIYAFVTQNIICGGTKMRAIVNPTEKARERYDNSIKAACAIATMLGAAVASIVSFSIPTLFILALVGNTIDNFFYLYIYHKIRAEV